MSVFSALLNNGPLLVGPLADRGAFDPYASYRPGQVVVDDSVVYLNIAAIGGAPELEDTFDRRDQQGWGQSSHGEVWQTSATFANQFEPLVRGGGGLFGLFSEGYPHGQLLGPARSRGDCELLARIAFGLPPEDTHSILRVALNATEDNANYAFAEVNVNHITVVSVAVNLKTVANDDGETGPNYATNVEDGAALWLRLRRVGLVYSATAWAVGLPEPATPQVTATASEAQPAGHPLFYPQDLEGDAQQVVQYVSVRPLTSATAPGDDDEHWVALADALQVPPPL